MSNIKLIIKEAKELLKKSQDSFHDICHTQMVVKNARMISQKFPDTNKEVIIISAWWHDVGRIYKNKGHENLSFSLVSKELRKFDYNPQFIKKVKEAIIHHKWNMIPRTIEGIIVKDADKLDLIRGERYKLSKNQLNYLELESTLNLLPILRDKILTLEISKKIFDKRINQFNKFIKLINKNNNYDII